MRLIPMTHEQVESFSAQFKGDREHIVWNDGNLEVPNELYDEIMAIDLTIPPPMFSGVDLDDLKKQASAFVDTTAEEQRQRWVTPGEGQAMTYQAKAQEAATYLNLISNNLAVDPARFPFLFAEIGVSGKTLEEVARTIDDVHQRWAKLAAGIERARLNAKSSIASAKSANDIQTVLDGIQWPEAPVADAPAMKKSKTK